MIDADGNQTTSNYRYDLGKVSATQRPPVASSPSAVQSFDYYENGRVKQVTAPVNGVNSYTKWFYPLNHLAIASLSTIENGKGEVYSAQVFDGQGRLRATAKALPDVNGYYNGPASGANYIGQYTEYDARGQVVKQSTPTEMINTWQSAGDDLSGWLFTQQTYDWKGRPLISYNTDMTYKEVSYNGCGCAGSDVLTTDELGNQQKLHKDPLGRIIKTEVFKTDGNHDLYLTTTYSYNALDQIVSTTQRAAATGVTQTSTMTYDGFGRLATSHTPKQKMDPSKPQSSDHTSYAYNADDTVQQVTDARGMVSRFEYNGRQLLKKIIYDSSADYNIEPAATVTFGYDAAGNRSSMTDGQGTVNYQYDASSRLTSETRNFTTLNRSYTLSYEYNLSGALAKLTEESSGANFVYTHDAIGRLTEVKGSPFAGVTNYVTGIQYRAWGGIKSASYGNNSVATISYNSRLQPKEFRLIDNTYNLNLMLENYSYYNDGRLWTLTDLDDAPGNNPPSTLRFLTRSYQYDMLGRVTFGGGSQSTPFKQFYDYDEFGNMKNRSGSYYYGPFQSEAATYTDNRRNGWTHDPEGQVISSPASSTDDARTMSYNAAGQLVRTVNTATGSTVTYDASYDGDGRSVRESQVTTGNGASSTVAYIVRSTVLDGQEVTRLDQAGNKTSTSVPADGLLFAKQFMDFGSRVAWIQRNPLGITETSKGVYDPLGNYIPFQQMADPRPPAGSYNSSSMTGLLGRLSNPNNYGMGCFRDGQPTNCDRVLNDINHGLAQNVIISGTANPLVTLANNGFIPTTTTRTTTLGQIVPNVNPEFKGISITVQSFYFVMPPGSQPGSEVNPIEQDPYKVERDAAKKGLDILRSNEVCRNYIRDLINATRSDVGFNPTLDPATTDYEMGIKAYMVAIDANRVTRSNKSGSDGSTITWGETDNNAGTVIWYKEFYNGQDDEDRGVQTIHESLHQLPGFTDQALARAASILAAGGNISKAKSFSYDKKGLGEASRYLQDEIKRKCSSKQTKPGETIIR